MSGAHFSIVGIFSTSESAQSAAVILDVALKSIAEWHSSHPEKSREIKQEWPGLEPIITPVEEDLRHEYGVEWGLPVLLGDAYELSTYRNYLFLENNWSTQTGAYPLDHFIERLGGTALVQGDYDNSVTWGEVKIKILCVTPNQQITQDLLTKFNGQKEEGMVEIEIEEIYDGQSIKSFGIWIPEIMEYIKSVGCRNINVLSTQCRSYYVDWDK